MLIYGRDQERQVLTSSLDSARSGTGRVLVVRGEAGIGKTTLLRDAAGHASDMRQLTCSGVESEVELAFSGLHQLLGPVLDELGTLPDVQARALAGALGLADAPADRFLVGAAVLTLLAQVAERGPLLVIVDDLQFLDRASTAALLFAARRLVAEPMAMLLGVRDPDRRSVDTADLPELWLSGLSEPAASRLLTEHGKQMPAAARESVVAATAGNPLALTEITRLADIDGVIGRAILQHTVPLGPRLRAAFAERVDGLSASVRAMLEVAAADDTGQIDIVLAAAERLGTPARSLSAADESALVDVDGATLRFRHPLIRSAIYQDTPARRRCAIHEAIGAELAARGQHDHAVWHQAVAATVPDEKLAQALEKTAEVAARRGGGAAVASVWQRAAALSRSAVGRTRRLEEAAWAAWQSGQSGLAKTLAAEAANGPGDLPTRARLSRLHGFIELASGDPAVACTQLTSSADLVVDSDPGEAANLLMLSADAAFQANRMDDAERAARRIVELDAGQPYEKAGSWLVAALAGRLSTDDAPPWQLLDSPGGATLADDARQWAWTVGIWRFGSDRRQAREFGVAVCDQLRAAGMHGIVAVVLPWLVELEFNLCQWPAAAVHAEHGMQIARDTGQQSRINEFQSFLACIAAVQGDAPRCETLAEQAIESAVRRGNQLVAARANWALAHVALSEGDAQDAFDRLVDLHTPGSPCAHQHIARITMPDLVDAAVRSDRADYVQAIVAEYREWAVSTSLPWAHAHLLICEALLAHGERADELFRSALAAERTQDRPFDSARIALRYGEWLRRNRRRSDSRRQLRAAAAQFDRLGATVWNRNTQTQLRSVGGAASVPRVESSGAGVLTTQELQVAQLAAQGLSNREIGARLYLSPRTVGYHLYKLFPKLGIAARSQLRGMDFGDRLPDVS